MAANGLPSQPIDVVGGLNEISPIGNPAEIFMNLFKGLSKVVIENISKQQATEAASSEEFDDEPVQEKMQKKIQLNNTKAKIEQIAKQTEESLQKVKAEVESKVNEIPKLVEEVANKTKLENLMPHKTPEIMKQVVSKIQAKEAEVESLAQAEVKTITNAAKDLKEKVNVIIKKSTIPGEEEVLKTVETFIKEAPSKEEIAKSVKTVINQTVDFVDPSKKMKDEDVLTEMDVKLKNLEKVIEKNLNMSVFEAEKFHNIKEKFQADFDDMKEKFVDKLEKFSEGLKTYSEKISENRNNKKVRSTTQKCVDGKGDGCYYDLDESLSTSDMDTRLVDLNKSIMSNLNSTVFEHHKFHRSKSHFIHEYKKAKHVYLMKLNKIAAEISDFVKKAKSKRKDDKLTVKKEEDGFLYRNEQSLF